MAFDFKWKPQKLPLQMINGNSRAASDAMAGYVPQEADPNNPYYTQGIPAENAAAMMQGYTEEQSAPYVGRTPEAMNNAGQGAGYQFKDPEFDAYMQQQEKAANEAVAKEQEMAAKEQEIAKLKSDIKTIETRLAENKSKLQKWTGNTDKIAAIEARKINQKDPTSIWRWKAGMDFQKQVRKEDLERIEKEKQKTKDEQKQFIRNKIAATLPTMSIGWKTSPEQIQQFKNTLAGLKTEAMNSNLSDQYNNILEAEAQLNGQLPQQRAQMAMDAMANATNLFNVTKEEGGFGKDPKAYHDYLLQQYTQITRDFPEAKYDPAFNKAFSDADKLYRKTVKSNKVRPSGRR